MNTKSHCSSTGNEWWQQFQDLKMVAKNVMKSTRLQRPTLMRLNSEGSCDSLISPEMEERPSWQTMSSTRVASTHDVSPFIKVVQLCGKSNVPPPFAKPRPLVVEGAAPINYDVTPSITSPFPSLGNTAQHLVKGILTCPLYNGNTSVQAQEDKLQKLEGDPKALHRTYASVVASGPRVPRPSFLKPPTVVEQKLSRKVHFDSPWSVMRRKPNVGRTRGQRCPLPCPPPSRQGLASTRGSVVSKGKSDEGGTHSKKSGKRTKAETRLKCQGGPVNGTVTTLGPGIGVSGNCVQNVKGGSGQKPDKPKSLINKTNVKQEETLPTDVVKVEDKCPRICLNNTIASILGWATNLKGEEDHSSDSDNWDEGCDELDAIQNSDILWALFTENNRWDVIPKVKEEKPSPSTDVALAEVNRRWREEADNSDSGSRTNRKTVRFAAPEKLVKVYPMVAWAFAYQSARKGHWEEFQRDWERFQHRIDCVQVEIASVLHPEHRKRIYAERFSNVIQS